MLMMLEKPQLPSYGERPKSERRQFAEKTLGEFTAMSHKGDIAEVTEWPRLAEESVENAQKMAGALRDEAFKQGLRDEVQVMRRGSRLFLKRFDVKGERK